MSEVPINPVAVQRPAEMGIIGALILAYNELEFLMTMCAEEAVARKDDMVKRALFRANGNMARLEVADALMRPAFEHFRLSADYKAALVAVRNCLFIRNRYAHAGWGVDTRPGVFFCDVETTADDESGFDLRWRHIDVTGLEKQVSYFSYARATLIYLELELPYRKWLRTKRDRRKPAPPRTTKPPEVGLPPPHNDPKKHVPQWLGAALKVRFLERIAKAEENARRQQAGPKTAKPKKPSAREVREAKMQNATRAKKA